MKETTTEEEKTPEELIDSLGQIFSLKLKSTMEWNEDKLKEMHPIDMMEQINLVTATIQKYIFPFRKPMAEKKERASKAKWLLMWEDIETEFGIWSHYFNKILRGKIKELATGEDEALANLHRRFVYVYAYWWNTYHLVTEVMKKRTKCGGATARKHIVKGRHTLARLINGEVDESKISAEFLNLIRKLEQLPIESEIKPTIFSE